MKNQLLVFLFSSVTLLSSAQDQLLNASFENWTTNPSLLVDSPDDWWGGLTSCRGFNPPVCKTTMIKTTDAHQGTYAVRLENINDNSVGKLSYILPNQDLYTFTSRPVALTGYYKFNNAGSDKITISIELFGTDNTDYVGTGTLILNASRDVYTVFNVPIIYTSTAQVQNIAVRISFDEYSNLASTFTVDDLFFKYGTTTAIQSAKASAGIQFFPNPAIDVIYFEKSVTNICVSTTNGSHVLEQPMESNSLNIDALQKGIYIISYECSGSLIHGKLIVEK